MTRSQEDMVTDKRAVTDGPRASRTLAGRPSGPVPWTIWGTGRAWARGSYGGLLELTDIGDRRIVRLSSSSLDPTGTRLRFERRVRGPAPQADEHVEHDLLTGRQTVEAPRPLPQAHGPNGEVLDVTRTSNGQGRSTHWKYVLTHERSVTELPVDDRFSYNQTGPAAQFTSDGRHLALSHQTPDRQISGVTTIDLVRERVERFDGVELVGSGCWSPDGSRLLVASTPGGYPEVLDTRLGSLTRLDNVIENPRDTPWLTLVGWINDTSLLAYRDAGTRMHFSVVDVASGKRRELLSVARPAPKSEINGVFMAQYVAQGSPASCALPPDRN